MPMEWFTAPEHQPFEYPADSSSAALLIHGFMGTPAEMRPLGAALADAGVAARGILLPGMGAGIERLARVGRDEWVRAAREGFDSLASRFEHVTVIGYSLGGAVALHLAASRNVHRLALIAPLWKLLGGDPRVLLLPVAKHIVKQFRPFEKADFADPNVRQFFEGSISSVNLDNPTLQHELRQQATLPTATLDEVRRTASASAHLAARVAVPSLIVQGMYDTVVRPGHTRELLTHFGGALAYHQIPGDHLFIRDDRPSWPLVRDLIVPFASTRSGTGLTSVHSGEEHWRG